MYSRQCALWGDWWEREPVTKHNSSALEGRRGCFHTSGFRGSWFMGAKMQLPSLFQPILMSSFIGQWLQALIAAADTSEPWGSVRGWAKRTELGRELPLQFGLCWGNRWKPRERTKAEEPGYSDIWEQGQCLPQAGVPEYVPTAQ